MYIPQIFGSCLQCFKFIQGFRSTSTILFVFGSHCLRVWHLDVHHSVSNFAAGSPIPSISIWSLCLLPIPDLTSSLVVKQYKLKVGAPINVYQRGRGLVVKCYIDLPPERYSKKHTLKIHFFFWIFNTKDMKLAWYTYLFQPYTMINWWI